MNDVEIISRLKQCLDLDGSTPNGYALKIGVDPGNFRKMLAGTQKITDKTLNKVSATCGVNLAWLKTGQGEMLKATRALKNEVEDLTPDEHRMIMDGLRDGTFRLVPLINIDSVGGIHSDNQITPSEQYVIKMMPFTEAREGDVAIIQSGNSMSPTIPSGSVLLIREVTDWREYFGYGNIYVLWLRDGRRITKEVRRYNDDPQNYVWCVSYNPDVADEELPRTLIRGVWKVIKYVADYGW